MGFDVVKILRLRIGDVDPQTDLPNVYSTLGSHSIALVTHTCSREITCRQRATEAEV